MPPPPSAMPSSVPRRLRAEWTARWAGQLLQLPDGRTATGADWLATVRATAGAEQDLLLAGLLELVSDGEQAAERLLWILLIPPVDRAAPATAFTDHQAGDRSGVIAAAVWETLRCHRPARIDRHLFRVLVRDATGRLTGAVSKNQRKLRAVTHPVEPDELIELAGPSPLLDEPAEIRLARLLAEAVTTGIASLDEIELLRRSLLQGSTIADVAAAIGVAPGTLRRRLQRLTHRLADHLGATA